MRHFIDMDGTLVTWDYVPTDVLYSDGYFADLAPHPNVVEAVKQLIDSGNTVYILSAYPLESSSALRDKNLWLDRNMNFIPEENRIFMPVGCNKYDYVPGGVHADDVLLDDYTPNLLGWAAHSGTGVKLLNGSNHTHKTWKGAMTRFDESPAAIAQALTSAVN